MSREVKVLSDVPREKTCRPGQNSKAWPWPHQSEWRFVPVGANVLWATGPLKKEETANLFCEWIIQRLLYQPEKIENGQDSTLSHPKSPCVKHLSRCWITVAKANGEKLDRKYIQKEEMLQIVAFVHSVSDLPITHTPNSRPLVFQEPLSSGITRGNTMPWGFCHLKPLHQMEQWMSQKNKGKPRPSHCWGHIVVSWNERRCFTYSQRVFRKGNWKLNVLE